MNIQEAKKTANYILEEFWNGEFPVDPFIIAKKMNVDIMAFADEDTMYSGAYYPKHPDNNDKPTIIINKNDGLRRVNFTIAHELGHHILHGDERFRDPINQVPGTDLKEMEANAFAANLLMPETYMRIFIESGKYYSKTLMNLFNVSYAAIMARYRSLGYKV